MGKKKSVVERKFLRDNPSLQYTRLWKDMDDEKRNMISNSVSLDMDEEMILVFYPTIEYWWALTNKKIVINDGGRFQTVDLYKIERIELNQIFAGLTNKKDNTSIDLYSSEEVTQVQLEKHSWPGIYNLFKFIIS